MGSNLACFRILEPQQGLITAGDVVDIYTWILIQRLPHSPKLDVHAALPNLRSTLDKEGSEDPRDEIDNHKSLIATMLPKLTYLVPT